MSSTLTDEDIMRILSREDMHAAWATAAILLAQGMSAEAAADESSKLRKAVNERLVAEYRERIATSG